AGENIMFGGADPLIAGLVPSDIEIRRNYLRKPLAWKVGDPSYAGIHWMVKNLLELKNAQRVLIDGNILEHVWPDAQGGTAVLFTPRNEQFTAPQSIVADITFTNNLIRDANSGISVLGSDDIGAAAGYPSQQTVRVLIRNNLVELTPVYSENSVFLL